MVYCWIKEAGLTNLSRSGRYKEQSSGVNFHGEKAVLDIFCTYYQHPNMDLNECFAISL